MKKLIVEYFKDVRSRWRFRLKAVNGRILASSEAYSSLKMAERGASSIMSAKSYIVRNLND